jgi:biotin operon repressor
MSRTSRKVAMRQVEMAKEILSRGPQLAAELAKGLGMTVRTVNRLLGDLRATGVPIRRERAGFRARHWIVGPIPGVDREPASPGTAREDRAPESPQPSPEMESREVPEPAAPSTFAVEDDWE